MRSSVARINSLAVDTKSKSSVKSSWARRRKQLFIFSEPVYVLSLSRAENVSSDVANVIGNVKKAQKLMNCGQQVFKSFTAIH